MMSKTFHAAAILVAAALIGARISHAEVEYVGLDEHMERNARALMPLASAGCDSARWRVERLYRDSEKNLRRALEALGYYDISVVRSIDWSNPDCWKARFELTVGEPARLREVSVEITGAAADDEFFQRTVREEHPAPGEVLHHGRYEAFKRSLITTAEARGYFDAGYEQSSVTVDPESGFADLRIILNSGDRYRFGKTDFTEGILRPELLQGYSDIRVDEPYDARAISRLYEALNGSGYFESVRIRAEPSDDDSKTVPVYVSLTPGMRRVYSAGLGFSTDFGPQGRLGYADRRRNDRGHQFESLLYVSSIESSLTASYRWPRRDPRSDWYNVYAGIQRIDTDTSESDKVSLGIRRSKNISEHWLETRYVNIDNETFRVADQKDTSRLIVPGVNWESTRGSEIVRINRGHRMNLDVRGTSDVFGSDTTFLQVQATGKWIFPVGKSSRLLARVDMGTTFKDRLSELPASVRFFAGGDNSVRGYGFETLGPVDSDGNVIGGSHLVTASIEFDFLIAPKWSVAAFTDSGSAFEDSTPDLSTGVGLGLRWYSPLGPIRLDLAHPLNDPDSDFRIHITLGPDL